MSDLTEVFAVAKDLPISEAELRVLAALVRSRIDFMIVGLSGAALQGAPVVTEDVDLWFRNLGEPRMVRALREVGATYVPPFDLNPPMLVGDGTQPFDIAIRMSGLGAFEEEITNTVEVELGGLRLRVLSLERILASKVAANRLKDRLVIPVLRDTLASRIKKVAKRKQSLARAEARKKTRRRPGNSHTNKINPSGGSKQRK